MIESEEQSIGKYRLLKLLSENFLVATYQGTDLEHGRPVLVKILKKQATLSEKIAFTRAARVIVQLDHPAIVRIQDFGKQDGLLYFTVPFASSGSARQLFSQRSLLSLRRIVVSVKQIAKALHYAYTHGILHEHLTPENILFGSDGKILLSDFGFSARLFPPSSLPSTMLSSTITYLAPEQLEGKPQAASDQYALGAILYEWLSGDPPFSGSAQEMMQQKMSHIPLSFSQTMLVSFPLLEEVVLIAMAKDPRKRFANVQSFVIALEQATS